MSKGEFTSVLQANGGLENMINWGGGDKELLALIKYLAEEEKNGKGIGTSTGNQNAGSQKWKTIYTGLSA